MKLSDYFDVPSLNKASENYPKYSFGSYFLKKINKKDKPDIALLGVSIDSDEIRQQLYNLMIPTNKIKCIDLGNIKKCKRIEDTYSAVVDIHLDLIGKNIVPVLIGNNVEETKYVYHAFGLLKRKVNIAVSSPYFQFTTDYKKQKNAFINDIIQNPDNFLDIYSNIGYQQYFVSQDDLIALRKLYFEAIRLGIAKQDLSEVEPLIRDADIFSMDMSVVKSSDSPANKFASPNGFFANEVCQLAKYSGLSLKNSAFGIYGFSLKKDKNNQTSALIAQIIWHYIQGFYSRVSVNSEKIGSSDMLKFIVPISSENQNLIFYKHKFTEKWWVEIPVGDRNNKIISCSYSDYNKACGKEIPERWLKAFQRLN